VQRTAPAADNAPRVSVEGSTLTGSSLTMLNSTYDGVTELRTVKGSVRVLQFSIDTTINQPFKLDIAEAGPHSTVITSTKLTTSGHVKFYTPKFTGRLFGIFPVTFTPESPPPLTLPVLTFTDVKITLTLVQCDTLNADNLGITPT
jgi:hypothetical protein